MAEHPNDITQLSVDAIALIKQRQFHQAIQIYEKLLPLAPHSLSVLINLGLSYIEIRQYEKASQVLRQAISINPQLAVVWRNLTLCQKYDFLDNPDFEGINLLMENPDLSEEDETQLFFALGKIYFDTKHYEQAYQSYERGNILRSKVTPFQPANLKNYISGFIKTYSKEFIQKHHFDHNDETQPIIIVGPSRTGKSLLANLLAQMPQIQNAGEVGIKESFAKITLDPQFLTIEQAHSLRNLYLTKLKRDFDKASYIIDTLAGNFVYIGLLIILFPNAKIIYCQRDPLDTTLSMFFKYYVYGHGFTCHLQSIKFYLDQYNRMMNHWENVLPQRICKVSYEELIKHPSKTMQTIKNYLNLKEDFHFDFGNLHSQGIGLGKHFEKFISPKKKVEQEEDDLDLQDLMVSAYQRFEEGDLQSAENICLSLLAKEQSYSLPYHVLGLIYYQQGNNKKAITFLEEALKISPHSKQLNADLALIKNQSKD